jgi:hypothetical protein
MGVIQTYYYLAIISITIVSLTLAFVWVAARQARRLFRAGEDPVVAWLITAAIALMFLFIVGTTVGILVGVILSGRT